MDLELDGASIGHDHLRAALHAAIPQPHAGKPRVAMHVESH